MSRSDYRRPADYQINNIYQCAVCGAEIEQVSVYSASRCMCGGELRMIGESYPASSDDWDEERNPNSGDWERRRY